MSRLRDLSIHVERLVLRGASLDPRDTARFQRAFERELARLLAHEHEGTGLAGGAVDGLSAPSIALPQPSNASDLGRRTARSVHQSMVRGR